MGDVRVAAIASLTPFDQLDGDPFLVDTRSQQAICARWAADRGYVVTRQLRFYGLRPDHHALWTDVEDGDVELFVAASDQVLARALTSVTEFAEECGRRGVRLETVGLDDPAYSAGPREDDRRGLSVPAVGRQTR
ncbi:hypothetical protein ACPXCE_01840 [Streptomyces sp. DT24]|uniref:hypothetical protein n=1 Tax=unclassified Streptomyces TaxID=2593676 RepID=UPI0023B8D0A5|nr:hypothetical protein [Streptomyces sp. AM 4-1-1]WEH36753.1 hypothetical protein PZB75_27415 [Streptomyces sp. AM 4-1-1]